MKKRILVADDIPEVILSLQGMLSPYFDVTMASCGLDVLDLCEDEAYYAVLLDKEFTNGMSGLDTARLLRQRDSNIRIVIMSALRATADIERAVRAIGATYIEKTFDVARIREVLEG